MRTATTTMKRWSVALLVTAIVASPAEAATKTFTGGGASTWFTPGSWSPAGVPTAADDVIIPAGLSCLVSGAPSAACRSLTQLGTMTLPGGVTLSAVEALNFGPGSVTNIPAGALTATTIDVQGSLAMGGIQGGGGIITAGSLTVDAAGTLSILGTASVKFAAEVTNHGAILMTGGSLLQDGDITNFGSITVGPQVSGAWSGLGPVRTVTNHGTLTVEGDLTIAPSVGTTLVNHGSILASGAMRGSGLHDGTCLATASGALFQFLNPSEYGPSFLLEGPASLAIQGTWPWPIDTDQTVTLGAASIAGGVTAGTLNVNPGAATCFIDGPVTAGEFNFDTQNGVIEVIGPITVTKTGVIDRGTMKASKLVVAKGATVTMGGSLPGIFRRFECDIDNFGALIWTNRETRLVGTTLTNHGLFEIQAISGPMFIRGVAGVVGQRIVNLGTMVKTGTNSFSTENSQSLAVFLEQRGTLVLEDGVTNLGGALFAGTTTAAPATKLNLRLEQSFEPGHTFLPEGKLSVLTETFEYPGDLTVGELFLETGTCTIVGDLNASLVYRQPNAGALSVGGDVLVTGTPGSVEFWGDDAPITVTGSLSVEGKLTVTTGAELFAGGGTTAAELVFGGGRIDGAPAVFGKPTLSPSTPGGTFATDTTFTEAGSWLAGTIVLDGAVLTFEGALSLPSSNGLSYSMVAAEGNPGNEVRFLGPVTKLGNGSVTVAAPILVRNDGSISVQKGTLHLGGGGAHQGSFGGVTAGTLVLAGSHAMSGPIAFVGSPSVKLEGAGVSTAGALFCDGPWSLTQGATLAVGGSLAVNALFAIGDGSAIDAPSLAIGPAGRLRFGLAGAVAAADGPRARAPLEIGGDAIVQGTIEIALPGDAELAPCTTIPLLSAGALLGEFGGAVATEGTAIWTLDVPRSTVMARYSDGDLDGSGAVSVADIPLLLRGWGEPGPADFNCDENVDGVDLALLLGAIRQADSRR